MIAAARKPFYYLLEALIDGQDDPAHSAEMATRRRRRDHRRDRRRHDPVPHRGHLVSWAGTCPGTKEFAGRDESIDALPGKPYLMGALGIVDLTAARNKCTY